jgi:hypothetical protein
VPACEHLVQQLYACVTLAGHQHSARMHIVLWTGCRLFEPELGENRRVPIIEKCRWVTKPQILRRAAATSTASCISGEILRPPNGGTAAPFARQALSFGPASRGWLRNEPRQLGASKYRSVGRRS